MKVEKAVATFIKGLERLMSLCPVRRDLPLAGVSWHLDLEKARGTSRLRLNTGSQGTRISCAGLTSTTLTNSCLFPTSE